MKFFKQAKKLTCVRNRFPDFRDKRERWFEERKFSIKVKHLESSWKVCGSMWKVVESKWKASGSKWKQE